MVFHDRTLLRTTGGRGRVSGATAASIRRLSAGRWFGGKFDAEMVPLLEEALTLAGETVGVNIELKYDSRREDPGPLVRRVREIVRDLARKGEPENILITSFHHGALAVQRTLAPEIATGLLVYPPGVPTTSGIRTARRIGATWVVYSGGNIRGSFVERAHAAGLRTMEYTVNGPMRYRRALRFGVDGIITNEPGMIRGLAGT